jgi:hypothetical protein
MGPLQEIDSETRRVDTDYNIDRCGSIAPKRHERPKDLDYLH